MPESLLIHSGTAAASDLGRAIAGTGVDEDTLKLLWTMAERHDCESQHAAFWRTLPDTIATGMLDSVPYNLMKVCLLCRAMALSTTARVACRSNAPTRRPFTPGGH